MRNVNINLTTEQAKLVDELARKYGFASRSEFFRAVLRHVLREPQKTLDQLIQSIPAPPPAPPRRRQGDRWRRFLDIGQRG